MINKQNIWAFKDTIGFLLFKKIFFTYVIFVLLISSYQAYSEYKSTEVLIKKDLKILEKSFSQVLSKGVWFFDEAAISSAAKGILNSKIVDGIVILTPKNELIQIIGMINPNIKEYKKRIFTESNPLSHSFEEGLLEHSFSLLDNKNIFLGKVHIYSGSWHILQMSKETFILIGIDALISALILWLSFVFFANKLLTIPLNQIINATKELEIDTYSDIKVKLNTSKKHELNTLVNTFNKMRKRINESYIDLKKLNIIQEEQKSELILANKSKDDFLANMSHELKTPLNSINVISSVMMKNKKGLLSDEDVNNMEVINRCGKDLLYLINDVLDISKLEAGEVEINYETINFIEMMNRIKEMIEPQVKAKDIQLLYSCDKKINFIYSDRNRIKQIVKNLLSNALKFVQGGTIELSACIFEDKVKLIVKDDGIGIAKEKLENIFDRFKQVDGSTTRKYGGTGLGLAICKELAQLLKGDITVTSEVDVGTVFTLVLPLNLDKINEENNKEDEFSHKDEQEEKILTLSTKINTSNKSTQSNNILILQEDPLCFMQLMIALKASYSVRHVNSISSLVKELKVQDFDDIIIDNSTLKEEDILKVLKHFKVLPILINDVKPSKILLQYSKVSLIKPFEKDDVLKVIRNKNE